MHEDRNVIAYLTSLYARASDSFIRGEVRQLRQLGYTVHTFSIREPARDEVTCEEVRREREATDDILSHHPLRLLTALVSVLLRHPQRLYRAIGVAVRCSTPGFKGRLWAAAYLFEAAYLARRLQSLRVDHLHNHIGEGSATVAMLASLLSGVPFSLTVHGPNEFDKPTLLSLDVKLRHAAFMVAVSHYGRAQILRWTHQADWPKVHVVRCGVDESFLEHPAPPIPASRQLVCVGRLSEQKGQLLLLEAAAQLADAGVEFTLRIVGDGPLRANLQQFVEARGLGVHVQIAGWMSSEQVREEILRSRALILPSFAEGLPVVFMEALALRRPVITTWVAGIPELIQPGVTGWLVPAGTVEELAHAMRACLASPAEQLDRMGAAGARRVARDHDAKITARQLADLMFGWGAGSEEDPVAQSSSHAADACTIEIAR